jgi:hypothetical protein
MPSTCKSVSKPVCPSTKLRQQSHHTGFLGRLNVAALEPPAIVLVFSLLAMEAAALPGRYSIHTDPLHSMVPTWLRPLSPDKGYCMLDAGDKHKFSQPRQSLHSGSSQKVERLGK